MWGRHLQIILNTNKWDITDWPHYKSANNYTPSYFRQNHLLQQDSNVCTQQFPCSAWEYKREGQVFIVSYFQLFIMQNSFYSPQLNCCSLSSLFKFTLPGPPSNSPLLLNRLRSSPWHHNFHTHLCWDYCSHFFITAVRLPTSSCMEREPNICHEGVLSFSSKVLICINAWWLHSSNTHTHTHFWTGAFTENYQTSVGCT